MRKNKIFILGGRSGTSLMLRLLTKGVRLKDWNKRGGEPSYLRSLIRKTYPNVPINCFDKFNNDFQVVKLPHFDFIIDKIIEKYKNPIFIVMNRKIEDMVNSYKNTHFSTLRYNKEGEITKSNEYNVIGWASNEMYCSEGITTAMKEFNGLEIENDIDAFRVWLELTKHLREDNLRCYNKNLIFRIEFDEFMNNFEKVMIKLSKFLMIKPRMNKWLFLRKKKFSPSAKGINYYVKQAKKRNS